MHNVIFRRGFVSIYYVALIFLSLVSTAYAEGVSAKDGRNANGAFKYEYGVTVLPQYREVELSLKKEKLLENITSELNKVIILPEDITVTLVVCGTMNAVYLKEDHKIVLCYELIEKIAQDFIALAGSVEQGNTDQKDIESAIGNTFSFIFVHELGHALVHVLDLPITGKEEDAVDQLSTIELSDIGDKEEDGALDVALWFLMNAQRLSQLPFWDEHSLNAQRFYNIICWVYGKDPAKYAYLVDHGLLPLERAVSCQDEFSKAKKSWDIMLKPFIRTE